MCYRKLRYFLTVVTICAAQTSSANQDLDKMMQIHADINECVKQSGAKSDDVKAIWAPIMPASYEASCLLACVMKKTGTMGDDNRIILEKQIELTKAFKNDQLVKVFEKCKAEEIGGTDQCMAAKKYKECYLKYKTEYGVKDHF